ncbi:hypothetical protein GCM10010472_72790 [Pseudonocardia halophobica]|uniref:HTH marR-type domain-containing protein n=1 Tax=Pseudonocardia halophobica TaxID=29401 RepID=A0A9W6L2B4_9PSEU|nr:MarR family transcriptional regulator [Pseudonocardia halophobica]GLL10850.1 hypothetical protein GCM10017577_19910 [Pseudonocardia halophobica]
MTSPGTGPVPDPSGRRAGEAVLLAAARLTALLDEAASGEGLTPLQARFLRTLRDPVPQGRLAAALGIDPARVSALTRELAERGLVERVRADGDRRQRVTRPTPEGEAVVARVGARLAAATPLTRALDRVERERLAELLERVVSHPGAPAAGHAEQPDRPLADGGSPGGHDGSVKSM